MTEKERPLKDRIWEFTKDLSVKVSRKAEKHWKINTLRVEIASIKHKITNKHKELGRYVYESHKAGVTDSEVFQKETEQIFEALKALENNIVERSERIELLEAEIEVQERETTDEPDVPSSAAEPHVSAPTSSAEFDLDSQEGDARKDGDPNSPFS